MPSLLTKNASLAKAVTCADHFICADAHNKLCFKTSCGKMLGNHWFITFFEKSFSLYVWFCSNWYSYNTIQKSFSEECGECALKSSTMSLNHEYLHIHNFWFILCPRESTVIWLKKKDLYKMLQTVWKQKKKMFLSVYKDVCKVLSKTSKRHNSVTLKLICAFLTRSSDLSACWLKL